jgi:acyl-CoA synthetase (NDP forming)
MVVALANARAQAPEKPVLLVTYGDIKTDTLAAANVTVFGSAQSSIESLAHAVTYASWLRTPHAEPALPDQRRANAAGGRVEGLIEDSARTDGWLPPERVGELLAPYGMQPVGQVMDTPMRAAAAAEAVGYPVAVKVADPQVVHKSDRGLVRVDLNTPSEVCEAVAAFECELSTRKVPVLVQPMLSGVEIALGLLRDPTFGPLVMVAAGGVDIDVWDDRAFLLPPVTRQDAARGLRSLRIWPLLKGHRGRPAADLDGIESLIVSLGQLALDVPEIAELDLNPVLVGPEHASVVDAKVRVTAGRPIDAGIPRRLRVT